MYCQIGIVDKTFEKFERPRNIIEVELLKHEIYQIIDSM